MFVWEYNSAMLPFLASVFITISLIFIGWRRYAASGAGAFVWTMMAITIYVLGYMLELGSQNIFTITLLAKIEFVGVVMMPVGWLTLALTLTNRGHWLTWPRLAALCVIPLATLLLVWTNEAHGLIWQTVDIERPYGFAAWRASYGLWYVVHIVYFQLLTLLGAFLLAQGISRTSHVYRRQVTAVLLALIFPWFTNIIYFLKIIPLPFNPTAFAFAISGLCVAWAVFRCQFLDLLPTAWNTVIENLADGVVVLDIEHRIVDINPAAQHIAGRSSGFIGKPITAVFPQSGALLSLNGQVSSTCVELAQTNPDGRRRTFDCHLTPLYDRQRRVNGRVLVLVDVTERKETEEAMRLAKEAAERAHREAEAANRAKSTFLSNISHELRTPLTIISLYTEILQKLARAQQHHDLLPRLEQIHRAARHLSNVVDDILDLSKIEAGMMELHEEWCNVHLLLQEVEMMAQPLIARNDNSFHLHTHDDLGYIYTDPTKLRQVLLNLLSNAAKFTASGEICLQVSRGTQPYNLGRDTIRFELSDTGIGMTAEQTASIFEPFTQVDSSLSRQYTGTGLGLTISRHFCQMMDGEITVHSEPNRGSTFTVELPVRLPEVQGVRAMPN